MISDNLTLYQVASGLRLRYARPVTPLLLDPVPRFLAQVVVILVVARLLGRLVRRLGQPMVVAEITAGILLGPSLLGWALPEVSAALFAPDSLVMLQVVSNLGLVLFMFFIGLELDVAVLRGRSRAPLVIAQATFLVSLGLTVLLALYLHPRFAEPHVPLAAFVLLLGAAMSSTAFPVLARIVAERRLLRARVGTMAITCAAVDDVLAWCLLAFVVAWARADGIAAAAVTTLLSVAYVAIMLFVVRPLLARLAQRVPTSSQLTHDRVAVVVLLVLASSCATELIGIHALFGAFLAGAVVPRHGGLAHVLAEKLEDLVVVVLVPLFFAHSGMRTELGLLDSPGSWAAFGVLVLVACVGKLGAGTLAARWSGLTWRESGALGILMNTRGLIVLIVLNLGLDMGVIGPTLFTMMVLMALVTTFITTPVLDLVYPPEQHVDDLLTATPSPAPRPQTTPGFTLLVCIDDERDARGLATLAAALDCAAPGTRTHALRLLAPPLSGAAARVAEPEPPSWLAAGIKPIAFTSTEPARDIRRVAEVKDADLVLMAAGRSREGLGPTARDVLRESSRSVAVLHAAAALEHVRRVLVEPSESARDGALLELCRRLLASGVALTFVRGPGRGGAAVDAFVTRHRHACLTVRTAEGTPAAGTEPRFDLVVTIHPAPALGLGKDPTPLLVVRGGSATRARDASA
jgi:Kef-type K+ transport system membrane component KefB